MTSLTAIMNTGLTALRASQAGLGVAAQNISNANTPGYVRTEISFTPMTEVGLGGGVRIGDIARAADRFLAAASFNAEATRGATGIRSTILARAQAAFGDPSTDTSLFASLDRVWSALTETSVDPSSTLGRDASINALSGFYAELRRTAGEVQSLIAEADERISAAVSQAQDLINRVSEYNDQVRLTTAAGGETAAVQNAQAVVIDQLSSILDIRVIPLADGSVNIRTSGGALLVGETSAQINYTSTSAQFATHDAITYNASNSTNALNLEPYFVSGELKGLLQVRDTDLKGMAEALGGLAASIGDALNEAHNENASYPAVGSLTGRQTGLLSTDALNFTGKATIGIVDSDGVLRQRLQIDFDAGQITGEIPPGTFSFANTIGAFRTALNNALGAATPSGQATFTDGRLSVSANGGGGLVIQQDPSDPSDRAGRGFSHFFGLNDLVERSNPLFFETGGSAADEHGLNSGGVMDFRVHDTLGHVAADIGVTISGALAAPGATWNDLVTALNNTTTGLGQYATFSYDSATGQIGWTPKPGFEMELTGDSTTRGTTGVSVSSLFGLGPYAGAARAIETDVATAISDDPTRLAVGRPDLTAAIGATIIEAGDNRGANALVRARDHVRSFAAAGQMTAQTTSLGVYAARLSGVIGRISADAQRAHEGADALSQAAADRRAQVEGVSIDDELVRMTTYQNAYAAASRLIQAANEMLRILLSIGTTTG